MKLILFFVCHVFSQWEGYQALSSETTMRDVGLNTTEFSYHDDLLNETGKTSFTYPKKCLPQKCEDFSGWNYADKSNLFSLSPLAALEHRFLYHDNDTVSVAEIGVDIYGRKGPLNFYIDVRMFGEEHRSLSPKSFDGEFIEKQEEGENSNFSFISFSRFRSSLNLNTDFGNLGYRRMRVHWGPGILHNLSFNRSAIPFDHFFYEADLGPLKVTSLWGRLSIDGEGNWRNTTDNRSIYAHRYEWNITSTINVGISEQLILYEIEEPFAVIPIVPLFVYKGTGVEPSNNGNISFDLNYQIQKHLRLYSEFMIDDMSEPSSLFNNFWKNRWAWMIGSHFASSTAFGDGGFYTEYLRVEPWVYTHYEENTAQALHRGRPLGSFFGPNSQVFSTKLYWRYDMLYLGLRQEWIWKGTDLGSNVLDTKSNDDAGLKQFLAQRTFSYEWSPEISLFWNGFKVSVLYNLNRNHELISRAGYYF